MRLQPHPKDEAELVSRCIKKLKNLEEMGLLWYYRNMTPKKSRAGFSDLYWVTWRGKSVLAEAKHPNGKGKLSPDQKYLRDFLQRSKDTIYRTFTSEKEFDAILFESGIEIM